MTSNALTYQATTTLSSPVNVEIDWNLLHEQRPAVLKHTDVPAYLILPEVHQLMNFVTNDNLLLMINTLWHTGARVSECLALTPNSFNLLVRQPYVSIETLKQRGRPAKGRKKPRLVPISNQVYMQQLQRYITSHSIGKHQRLFPITRSAVNKRINRLMERIPIKYDITVTPHTFRHSFTVHAILHATPLPILQKWLGHADINSTLIYTQMLSLDTYFLMQRIQF